MRSKTHVPEVVRAWRTGPGEDAWYALTAAERRGLLESLAPLGDDDDLDDVDLPGGARSFAAKPGVRELIEWILELAHGSALADPPHLGEYVRHAIPDFQKAMSLAQSCAARGRLGERISNPWALVATYSAHPGRDAPPRCGHGQGRPRRDARARVARHGSHGRRARRGAREPRRAPRP